MTFPVFLAYLTSLLKKHGFSTIGIDAVDKELGIWEFVELVKSYGPDIIFMEISTPSLPYDLECAERLKESLGCKIAFIGPHVNYFNERIMRNYNFVDFCIRDEFEFTALELCQKLKEKSSLKPVKGLTYREGEKITINEARPLELGLDKLPFPDREDFPIANYQQAFYSGKKTALMLSSRGCPSRCTFCIWPQTMTGHVHRARTTKNIVDEIAYLIKNHGVDELYFDDDTFIVDKQRVYDLCYDLLRRKINIPWMCMARVSNIDKELLKKMKQAGCTQIFYGFESGSQKILNNIKKGITLQQAINAVRLTQKAGMYATGSFIIGLPDDDKETIKETLKFAIKLRADYVQFALAEVFPGTELYAQAEKECLLKLNSWTDLDGTHGSVLKTRYLNNHELEGAVRKMYLGYYTSPMIILKNLQNIRTMSDLRKILRGAKSVLSRVLFYKE